MKDLLEYIVESILGKKDFTIEEEGEAQQYNLKILAGPEDLGIIIGKGGQIIKAIQSLVRVRGRLENKDVSVLVEEKK